MCLSLLLQISGTKKSKMMMMINKYNVNLPVHHGLGWNMGHAAAVSGNVEMAQELLKKGLNPDKGDKFGWTPRQLSMDLHGADIFQGETCRDKHDTPRQLNEWDISPVHVAAISGKPLQVVECVAQGLDFEKPDGFGYTALDYLEFLHGDGKLYRHLINIRKELTE